MPRSGGSILVATGYHKWGMTNGVAAAMILTADIVGRELDWAKTLRRRVTGPRDVATGVRFTVDVAVRMATDWTRTAWGALPGMPSARPGEGQGAVESPAVPPVAVSRVEGCTRRVDAVCSHLGGICRGTTPSRPGTAPCTDRGSVRTGTCWRARRPRTCAPVEVSAVTGVTSDTRAPLAAALTREVHRGVNNGRAQALAGDQY